MDHYLKLLGLQMNVPSVNRVENRISLTLIYMGYFDYLFYMGGGAKKPPPGLTLAFDFR